MKKKQDAGNLGALLRKNSLTVKEKETLKEIFIQNPSYINTWFATPYSDCDYAMPLGIDLNVFNSTPLFFTILNSISAEPIEILTSLGADTIVTKKQKSSWERLEKRKQPATYMANYNALSLSLTNYYKPKLHKIITLKKAGANFKVKHSAPSFDQTLLFLALNHKVPPIVIKYLIENGAPVNETNNNKPIIQTAIECNAHHQTIEYLIKGGADISWLEENNLIVANREIVRNHLKRRVPLSENDHIDLRTVLDSNKTDIPSFYGGNLQPSCLICQCDYQREQEVEILRSPDFHYHCHTKCINLYEFLVKEIHGPGYKAYDPYEALDMAIYYYDKKNKDEEKNVFSLPYKTMKRKILNFCFREMKK